MSPPSPLQEPGATRRFLLPFLFIVLLFVTLFMRRPDRVPAEQDVWLLEGKAMGTTYMVKIVPDEGQQESAAGEAAQAVDKAVQEVNQSMSTYQDDTELSQFNQSSSTDAVPVSSMLGEVIQTSLALHTQSGGAFDVTVGPLVNVWGFGPDKAVDPPTEAELATAFKRVGSHRLELIPNAEDWKLRKKQPDVYVDLSAIAKGYGVDRMAEALRELGFKNFLVEVGGEVVAGGKGPGNRPWRVGLETPDGGMQDIESTVSLGAALATSGNYRNFKMVDGKRIGHTLDPRTGKPVEHQTASVSVVSPSCMEADGWATALLVLGAEEGIPIANREGIAARFLVGGEDGTFSVDASTWWPRNTPQEATP